jgi:glyoxylase-like metal-dependent hydrolase (beta-lactamase superfamily II)
MTHFEGKGIMMTVPIWCAAATDGKHKVIVDSGVRELEAFRAVEPDLNVEPHEVTEVALQKIVGWKPEEVEMVINTHLHYDHCGRNKAFTNAICYTQRKEFDTAFNPPKSSIRFYDLPAIDKRAISYFKWCFVDGEFEILPGLRVIPTPGHTRGHQSAFFDPEDGVVCVSGDICNILANVNEDKEPNIVTDSEEVFQSLETIRRFAHFIIPGHEPSIKPGDTKFPEVV